jgi:hypothetical protein
MAPYATGGVDSTVRGHEGAVRIKAAYGATPDQRPVELKTRYDPDPTHLLCLNQNIMPRHGSEG